MKKYLRMSSAAVVIGTLRVKLFSADYLDYMVLLNWVVLHRADVVALCQFWWGAFNRYIKVNGYLHVILPLASLDDYTVQKGVNS